MLTSQSWQVVVNKKSKQTADFTELDTKVKAYIEERSPKSKIDMGRAWNKWISKFPNMDYTRSERYESKGALDEVSDLVGQKILGQQIRPVTFNDQLAKAAQDRDQRAESEYVTRDIEQEQQIPGGSNKTSQAKWSVKLTFEDRPTVLIVKTVILYRKKPIGGHDPTRQDLVRWTSDIQSTWKGKFRIGGASTNVLKEVQFLIEFRPWKIGEVGYEIDVVKIPVLEAQASKMGKTAQQLATADWRTKANARELLLDGSSMGTPDLGQWGVEDRQAVPHEFGHAIGNPDEYYVVSHNVNLALHRVSYNQKPFSTSSIMNNTSRDGNEVFKRHFAVVADLYRTWRQAQNTGPAPTIDIIQPAK